MQKEVDREIWKLIVTVQAHQNMMDSQVAWMDSRQLIIDLQIEEVKQAREDLSGPRQALDRVLDGMGITVDHPFARRQLDRLQEVTNKLNRTEQNVDATKRELVEQFETRIVEPITLSNQQSIVELARLLVASSTSSASSSGFFS